MLNFEIKFDFSKLEKSVEDKVNKIENLKPVMQTIAMDMMKETQLNFRNEKTPDNVSWQKSKRALRDGGKTLADTGRLKKSFSAKFDGLSAIVGTNVIYAPIHQFGGMVEIKAYKTKKYGTYSTNPNKFRFSKKRKSNESFIANIQGYDISIPTRPFLGINYVMRRRYERAIMDYVLHGRLNLGR